MTTRSASSEATALGASPRPLAVVLLSGLGTALSWWLVITTSLALAELLEPPRSVPDWSVAQDAAANAAVLAPVGLVVGLLFSTLLVAAMRTEDGTASHRRLLLVYVVLSVTALSMATGWIVFSMLEPSGPCSTLYGT